MTAPFDVRPEQVQTGAASLDGRTWSFVLNYPSPPKGLGANDTGSRWNRIGNTKVIREQVYYLTLAAKIPKLGRARVDVEWVVGTRRNRDASNLGLFTKPIYDAIAASHEPSAHVVADDSPEYLETPTPTIRYVKGAVAHFVITVTGLGA